MERQCAYGNLRALAKALELLLEQPVSASRIPDNVLIRPLRGNEGRLVLSDGTLVIYEGGETGILQASSTSTTQ